MVNFSQLINAGMSNLGVNAMNKLMWHFRLVVVVGFLVWPMRRFSWSRKILNRWETDIWASATYCRPHTNSLRSSVAEVGGQCGYMTWPALIDKKYFARHLCANSAISIDNSSTPSLSEVAKLFQRNRYASSDAEHMAEGRSNVLFMFFAQWFTDGVFRSDPSDPRKTTSSHQVDLAQIYGETESQTHFLRSGVDGKLKTESTDSGDYLPKLFKQENDKWVLKAEFENLNYLQGKSSILRLLNDDEQGDKKRRSLCATGLRSGSLSLASVAMNTLFMREHNTICDYLLKHYDFDDERIFQTARMINIIGLLKLVIGEYINHIAGKDYFALDVGFAEKKRWYRENWIPIEFNLLYRWHSLVPEYFAYGCSKGMSFIVTGGALEEKGLGNILTASVDQVAGDIGLANTPSSLGMADRNMIRLARESNLGSYNDYREAFKLKRLKHFSQLTDDVNLQNKLSSLYGDINNLEFIVGIFAEKKLANSLFGKLLTMMVANDAFTHIYTNPLLAKRNYTKENLTQAGLNWIDQTETLNDLIKRNVSGQDETDFGFKFLAKSACHLDDESDGVLPEENINQVLCPVLRTGIKEKRLTPDQHGLVNSDELKAFLRYVGFKEDSYLVSLLIRFAEKATERISKKGHVNLVEFSGTLQDHGSSSGILNHPVGFNKVRLEFLKSFSDDSGLLRARQLANATKHFHKNPVYKSSRIGMLFQLLELGSLLHIYGRKSGVWQSRFLTLQDIDDLWQRGRFPLSGVCSKDNAKSYSTIKAIKVHMIMVFWYVILR